MTPDHFQQQVVSALKGIEKTLRNNLDVPKKPVEEPENPIEEHPERHKYTLAHICIRVGKTNLMPYPAFLCSMCGDPKQSIDLFIEDGHFKQLEDLLKKLP